VAQVLNALWGPEWRSFCILGSGGSWKILVQSNHGEPSGDTFVIIQSLVVQVAPQYRQGALGTETQMGYYLIHTIYLILFVAVFARQLCLPVPAPLFLLSSGVLGAGKLDLGGVLLVAVLGCLLADLAWFEAGRLRGKRVLRLLCALTPDPSFCI
jgi:hypothetical protein